MALLLKAGREPAETWIEAFANAVPDLEVRVWPDCGDPADIQFALVSRMPHGKLRTFPNLRFIATMSVGLEHLFEDPTLPDHVPLIRSVNPQRAATMSEYVLSHVLRYHRRWPDYQAQQRAKHWERLPQRLAEETRIGILGLGTLGSATAEKLRPFGFDVAGWTRTPHADAKVANFVGPQGLQPFLARSDMLICLLPLTRETENIIDARVLAALPRGAYLINAARGEHVVDADLLAALDSGHLAGATLDAFRDEPLPEDHPFWSHEKITVTPHNSCIAHARYGVQVIAENIRRIREGRPLVHQVDRAAGY
jgi:glyoxylate/hydroxypyruvate reductase A